MLLSDLGINSLYREGAEIAIVGSLATHFAPAPFEWACSAGVISKRGRSSAFSPDADGYSPSVRVLHTSVGSVN